MKKFVPVPIIFLWCVALFLVFTSLALSETSLASTTPQISAGFSHTLALKSDGTVWAWGNNTSGELGNGSSGDKSFLPVKVSNLSNSTAISAGGRWNPTTEVDEGHSVALKSDGTVWAWGYNGNGELGDGTTVNRSTPVQVSSISNIIAIACGYGHTMALKADGTVWAWGLNDEGQLGDGTTTNRTIPVQVNSLSDVVAIECGGYHSLALKSDGAVWGWGYNGNGELGDGTTVNRYTPVQVNGISNVIAVAGGEYHSIALKSDGTVWAWGTNSFGLLGDGTTTNRKTPVQVSELSDVSAIAGGFHHTIALKSNGTVWTWGLNDHGQLGDIAIDERTTPGQVSGLSNCTRIDGGGYFTIALRSDGTVWGWGGNWYGQVGNEKTGDRFSPVQVKNLNLGQTTVSTPTPTSSPKPTPTPTPKASPSPTASTPTPTSSPTPKSTPTPAEGTGVIYGFVLDENEFAFKNVSVTLTYTNGYSKSAKTDSEGYYEFANLAAGDYTLAYSKDGYQTQTQEVSLGEDESLDLGTIAMEPVEKGMISGYVVDIKGDPIEYAKLKLKGIKTKKTKTTVSDADGFFEFTDLDADDYIITAKRSRYKSTRKTIQLEEGDEIEIEIEMKKTSRRGVMVLDQ